VTNLQDDAHSSTGMASSQTRGLHAKSLLEDDSSSPHLLSSSRAHHQQLFDVAPTVHLATSSRAGCYKSTWMMTSANTEDTCIDSSIVPSLRGY
jgi:hypothetical protein